LILAVSEPPPPTPLAVAEILATSFSSWRAADLAVLFAAFASFS